MRSPRRTRSAKSRSKAMVNDRLDLDQLLTVLMAVKRGDLSARMPDNKIGVAGKIADTLNDVIELDQRLTSELDRLSTVVGKEGRVAQRASLGGAAGAWAACVESMNSLVTDLVQPTTEVARVIGAVAKGDLSQTMALEIEGRPLTGEFLRTARTVNTMVEQLNSFASEVTRVAREVGTDGKLGGQAQVPGVSGTWEDLTGNVNFMASNLTNQVRNIAAVTTAVANGDLSKKITADARGEILELKNTINTMVDQLSAFASEVTRVAREVGTEGQLGGQAEVEGVSGTWKDLTDGVNQMAGNLTSQVRNIAAVTTAVANGDLSKKITVDVRGEILELKQTINTMVDQLNGFASEVTRVAREVGTEGQLGGQAHVRGVSGTWKDLTDNVNFMANNLTNQVRNIAAVTTAVANGDLSKKITVDVRGEILELKNTINTMVDQLNAFASEVTRVAREVGTEGKLGGQAEVKGVAGIWKNLTDNVNSMAANLTSQVRGIAMVVTAVAKGDLKQRLVFDAKGEIAALADTINSMTETLATFAEQVTTVAREVGIEGKLGGQANVPGAAGTWRDLTDNVNRLAANLTTQVRAIAEVATAVTKGNFSRSIAVEAAGEVAALKDNLNEMIRNLKDTTRINTEQDWLKTNLAKFTRTLQGQRDLLAVARLILSELAPLVSVQQGLFYINESQDGEADLKLLASFAHRDRKRVNARIHEGEGLIGQVAFEKERILLTDLPDDYVVPGERVKISSGLGESTPSNIVVLPVLFEEQVKAVIELASLKPFSEIHITFLDQLTESIGVVLNTLGANMRTEELLKQSQSLTQELQHQQQELQEKNQRLEEQARSLRESEALLKEQQEMLKGSNEDLEEKARLLAEQNAEVARKNDEIELARQELEEKAEQLALSSRYKSEFLANMSHELRTPLNSLLILSKLLSQNPQGNLTPQQTEYAGTIHSAGSDLLALINEILDLAKIESGAMEVDIRSLPFANLKDYVERNFRPLAESNSLEFAVQLAPDLPSTISTDPQRLQQIVRNLLSNAFKFTEVGSVGLRIGLARQGWSASNEALNQADMVIAFSVTDTGIGIAPEKHKVVFEAFQQADGTTSRKYGGTGLGLSISREIAALLHGEILVDSKRGVGSTFTLYLPREYPTSRRPNRGGDGQTGAGNGASKRRPAAQEPVPALVRHGEAGAVAGPAEENGSASAMPSMPSINPIAARGSAPADDRGHIEPSDLVLLIIEDDPAFASILTERAKGRGFKVIVAHEGEAGLSLARELKPSAITLDVALPGMNGWSVLDRLKHDPALRHIPVHILSATEDTGNCTLKQGARSFLLKVPDVEALDALVDDIKTFVQSPQRRLLIVEDDENQANSIAELVGGDDVAITQVRTGEEAVAAMRTQRFDCMVLDLGLPGMSGFELIDAIRRDSGLRGVPVVVYTARDLIRSEQEQLRASAEVVIIKDARSPERLLDETALFLHRAEASLPLNKQEMIQQARLNDPALQGIRVLIIDDDVRNVFALTAALEHRFGMHVMYADNGAEGIGQLKSSGPIDVILMDVMMPGMDGYETTRQIRQLPGHETIPIIALTAKAMKGDREKCLEAGASDYIAKPVDTDQLASLIRVWVGERKCEPESATSS